MEFTEIELNNSEIVYNKSSRFCRICHESEIEDFVEVHQKFQRLISPCNCTGTMSSIHLTCLEQWLTAANTDFCELCQFVYKVKRIPRSYRDFIKDKDNQGIRSLVADFVCFILITPFLWGSIYLCLMGASRNFNKHLFDSLGLICLCLVLIAIYFSWCYITTRYHLISWKLWRNDHHKIIIENDSTTMGQI